MKQKNRTTYEVEEASGKRYNSLVDAEDNHEWSFSVCKKIAQLTKVVYTLNCRVEDNDERMRLLSSVHTTELERLKGEYASKINAMLTEVMESKQQLERENKSLEQERRKWQRESEDQYNNKIKELAIEVKENKLVYKKKMEGALQKAMQDHCEELNKLRASKDAEIERLVIEYNDKYKTMLAEQLDAKDATESNLNKSWGEKLQQLQVKTEKKINDLSNELSQRTHALRLAETEKKNLAERERIALEKICELETSIEQMKEIIEHYKKDIAKSTEEMERLFVAKQVQSEEIEVMKRELEERILENNVARHDLVEKERYVEKLVSDCTASKNIISALTTERDAVIEEHEELLRKNDKLEKLKSSLQEQLNALGDNAAGNKAALSQLENMLHNAEKEKLEVQERLTICKLEHAEAISQLQAKLQEQVEHYKELANETSVTLTQTWKAKMLELQKEHEMENAEHNLLNTALKEEVVKNQSEKRELEETILKLREEVQLWENTHRNTEEALHNTQRKIEELEKVYNKERVELQLLSNKSAMELEELQSSLKKSSEWNEATRAAEKDELQRKFALEREEFISEIERIRVAAEQSEQQNKKTMEEHVASILSSHKDELLRVQKENEFKIREFAAKLEQSHEALSKEHSEQMELAQKAFTQQLDDANTSWILQRIKLEEDIKELQSKLSKAQEYIREMELHNENSATTSSKKITLLSEQLEQMERTHQQEVSNLKTESEALLQTTVNNLKETHISEIALWRNNMSKAEEQHKQLQEELIAKYSRELASMQSKHETEMHLTVQRMMNEKTQQLSELTSMYTGQINTLSRNNELASESFRAELQRSQSEVITLNTRLNDMSNNLTQVSQELERSEQLKIQDAERASEILFNTITSHENTVSLLKSEHEMQIRKLGEIHQRIVDDLNVQMEQSQLGHASREAELRSALKTLQHKYDYRESRIEDVQLINTLRSQLKEVQKALEKAYEDMKLYKLELINREENYNKLFNRTPLIAAHAQMPQSMPELFVKNKNSISAASIMTPTHKESDSLPMLHKNLLQNSSRKSKEQNAERLRR